MNPIKNETVEILDDFKDIMRNVIESERTLAYYEADDDFQEERKALWDQIRFDQSRIDTLLKIIDAQDEINDRISKTPFLIAADWVCDEYRPQVEEMTDNDYINILAWFRDNLTGEDLDRVTLAILYATSGKFSNFQNTSKDELCPF